MPLGADLTAQIIREESGGRGTIPYTQINMPQKSKKNNIMANKIYRTVIRFEVLSETPFEGPFDLKQLHYLTYDGDMSGQFLDNEVTNEELTGTQAVDVIRGQGSDPEFFQMDEEGNDLEE